MGGGEFAVRDSTAATATVTNNQIGASGAGAITDISGWRLCHVCYSDAAGNVIRHWKYNPKHLG